MPFPPLSPTDARAIQRLFALAEDCIDEREGSFNVATLPLVSLFARLREEHGLATLLVHIQAYALLKASVPSSDAR